LIAVTRHSNPAKAGSRGYTLVELLISLLILVTLTGAVFDQINQMQKKSSGEAMKLDMNQAAREFLDQTVRDLHMAGYPGPSMYANPQQNTARVAAGLVSVSPTQILFEGDVNNDGNVYSVNIQYLDSDPNNPGNPNCPCIRRNSAQKLAAFDSLHQPSGGFYVETPHVVAPGSGSGQSGLDLFAYYDQSGNPVPIGSGIDISTPAGSDGRTGQDIINSIKTIKINLSLATPAVDPNTSTLAQTSMSATATVNQ
jgi:prepilin-type N-terminal cleavage/methylation domain-containing protein